MDSIFIRLLFGSSIHPLSAICSDPFFLETCSPLILWLLPFDAASLLLELLLLLSELERVFLFRRSLSFNFMISASAAIFFFFFCNRASCFAVKVFIPNKFAEFCVGFFNVRELQVQGKTNIRERTQWAAVAISQYIGEKC